MNRDVIATDGHISLFPLAEGDKQNYIKLESEKDELFRMQEATIEISWMHMMYNKEKYFSVYDSEGEYCGMAGMDNSDDKFKGVCDSEIWIELLESKRYQGISERVLKLVIDNIYQGQQIEYTSIRFRMK